MFNPPARLSLALFLFVHARVESQVIHASVCIVLVLKGCLVNERDRRGSLWVRGRERKSGNLFWLGVSSLDLERKTGWFFGGVDVLSENVAPSLICSEVTLPTTGRKLLKLCELGRVSIFCGSFSPCPKSLHLLPLVYHLADMRKWMRIVECGCACHPFFSEGAEEKSCSEDRNQVER